MYHSFSRSSLFFYFCLFFLQTIVLLAIIPMSQAQEIQIRFEQEIPNPINPGSTISGSAIVTNSEGQAMIFAVNDPLPLGKATLLHFGCTYGIEISKANISFSRNTNGTVSGSFNGLLVPQTELLNLDIRVALLDSNGQERIGSEEAPAPADCKKSLTNSYYSVLSEFNDSAGNNGRFLMYAPFDISASKRYGLLFYFHGDHSAGIYSIVTPGLLDAAKKHQLILVGMQAPNVEVPGENIDNECWWGPDEPRNSKFVDDFIQSYLLGQFGSNLNLNRVFFSGASGGALFATGLPVHTNFKYKGGIIALCGGGPTLKPGGSCMNLQIAPSLEINANDIPTFAKQAITYYFTATDGDFNKTYIQDIALPHFQSLGYENIIFRNPAGFGHCGFEIGTEATIALALDEIDQSANDEDSDDDGLRDQEEVELGTDPNNSDTDADGVNDGQEINQDGSDPKDRGSVIRSLGKKICSEWNGFLGPVYNIMEHISVSSDVLQISSTLLDIRGTAKQTLNFGVAPQGQTDLLVHDISGWRNNTYGQICSEHNGSPGELDGRMIIYKDAPDSSSDFQFAFALPFSSGITGAQYVPINTFQPSLKPEDQLNLVANWIQVTNLESSSQSGSLVFYNQTGQEICSRNLNLNPGERRDTPAHSALPGETNCTGLGPIMVGLVAWKPKNNATKFLLRNVRYVYDNPFFFPSFITAFQLEGSVGSGRALHVPIDRRDSTAVLELSNTSTKENLVKVKIYSESGNLLFSNNITLAPLATSHLIADEFVQEGAALAEVEGSITSGLIAVVMQYGRPQLDPAGLTYMYGVQAEEGLSTLKNGSYNTFLNQSCTLFISNPHSTPVDATVKLVRSDGSIVRNNDLLTISGKGVVLYDCGVDQANNYGSVQLIGSQEVVSTIVRTGIASRYRFPTAMR